MPCIDRKAEYQRHKVAIKARVKKWVSENPERVRDYAKEYAKEYAKRPGAREKMRETSRRWNANNKDRTLFFAAKKRAARLGIDFNLDLTDVVIPDVCQILGAKIVLDSVGKPRTFSPSLDRIDPTKGYVKGNVWVISWRANVMKSNADAETLVTFARAVLRLFDTR